MVSRRRTGATRAVARWEIAAVGGFGLLVGGLAVGATSLSPTIRPLLIAAIALPFVAVIVGHVRHLLVGAIVLDTAFQWDANLSYDSAAASLGALGGINVSVTSIALGILYAMWITRAVTERNAPGLRLRPALPFLAYVAIVGLSAMWAGRSDLALNELWLLLQMAALLLYIVGTFRSIDDVRLVVTMGVVALLLESVLVLLVFYFGKGIDFAGLSTHTSSLNGGDTRPSGTLGSPNLAGGYLAMLLPLAAAALLVDMTPVVKVIAGAALGLGVIALVATQSRGAWVGFGCAAVIMSTVALHQRWLSVRAVRRLAALAAVVFLVAGGVVVSRLGGDDDGAAASRLPLVHLAWSMIRDAPLQGSGANNFSEKIPEYAGPEFTGEFLYAVHNKYLLIWSEVGLIGLIIFAWFLIFGYVTGFRLLSTYEKKYAPISLGILSGMSGHVIHMNFDVFRGRPMIQTLIIYVGVLVSMRALCLAERESLRLPARMLTKGSVARPTRVSA
jgi:putative inorganic carbon (hco3(-)) transporter